MQLIKNGALVTDEWTTLADDAEVPAAGPVIVSLARFKLEQNSLLARKDKLGICLKSGEEPAQIADFVDRFSLIALEFPAYRNGRAYSYAYLLRERYGFKGELRAVGTVLRDQFNYLTRVGFDTLEVRDNITPEIFKLSVSTFQNSYQTSADGKTPVLSLRQRRIAAQKSS